MDHLQRGKRRNRRRWSNKPRHQQKQRHDRAERSEDAFITEPQRMMLAKLGDHSFRTILPLTISTRGIGLTISRVTSVLRQRLRVGSEDIPVAAIYRSSLAQLQAKMSQTRRPYFAKYVPTDWRLKYAWSSCSIRPTHRLIKRRNDNLSQVCLIIDSVGDVEFNGKTFAPVFLEETNALNIRLDNLREYCVKMSKLETDSSERIQGYELNSIPNAKWKRIEENDEKSVVLINPDEIIPPDYDWDKGLIDDLNVVSDWLYELCVSQLDMKEVGATTNYGIKGDPGILVSTHVIPGQSLKLDNEIISGSQSQFWSSESISHASWCVGVLGLVGETLNPIVGSSRSNMTPMRAVVDWHQISDMTV